MVALTPPPLPPSLAPLKTNTAKVPLSLPAPDVIADALRFAAVPIIGQIVGDVSATPPVVTFGSVTQGKPAAQQVRLSVKDGKLWQGMQINSAVPWLSTCLLLLETTLPLPAKSGELATQSLEILLDWQAPPGRLQTQS